jgi:hypothetical protein
MHDSRQRTRARHAQPDPRDRLISSAARLPDSLVHARDLL